MIDGRQFLDYDGLRIYDAAIKEWHKNNEAALKDEIYNFLLEAQKTKLCYSLEEAQEYAQSGDAYIGERLIVIDDDGDVYNYFIKNGEGGLGRFLTENDKTNDLLWGSFGIN